MLPYQEKNLTLCSFLTDCSKDKKKILLTKMRSLRRERIFLLFVTVLAVSHLSGSSCYEEKKKKTFVDEYKTNLSIVFSSCSCLLFLFLLVYMEMCSI